METDLFSIGVGLLRANRNVASAVAQAWQYSDIEPTSGP